MKENPVNSKIEFMVIQVIPMVSILNSQSECLIVNPTAESWYPGILDTDRDF